MNIKKIFRNHRVAASTIEMKKSFRLRSLLAGFRDDSRLVVVDFLHETVFFAILRLAVRFPRNGLFCQYDRFRNGFLVTLRMVSFLVRFGRLRRLCQAFLLV